MLPCAELSWTETLETGESPTYRPASPFPLALFPDIVVRVVSKATRPYSPFELDWLLENVTRSVPNARIPLSSNPLTVNPVTVTPFATTQIPIGLPHGSAG